MTCAESLCCGTPVAGFFAGGPESIALLEYCTFVKYGDVTSLYKSIQYMLKQNIDRSSISQKAKAIYSKERMAQDYINIYKIISANE